MSLGSKYSLYAVLLDDVADVLISGITSQSFRPESGIDQESSSGGTYPWWIGLSGQAPVCRFGTRHCATALANLGGAQGYSIAALDTGLAMFLQRHLAGGTRTAGANHRKFSATEGLIIPRTLTCSHGPGQHADLTYEVLVTYDGSNNPLVLTENVALPAAEADDERFALGPITIESVSLPGVRQFEIDFGVNAVIEGADGDLWPTYVSIETMAPRITLRGIDANWFAAAGVPLTGLAITHANTALYLRKRAAGGTFVPDGTAEHIKFTANGLATLDDGFTATGQGASECSLSIPLSFDGTNSPLTINTASAIT